MSHVQQNEVHSKQAEPNITMCCCACACVRVCACVQCAAMRNGALSQQIAPPRADTYGQWISSHLHVHIPPPPRAPSWWTEKTWILPPCGLLNQRPLVLRVYTACEEVVYLRPPSTWHTLHPLTQIAANTSDMYTDTRGNACHFAGLECSYCAIYFCRSNRQVVQLPFKSSRCRSANAAIFQVQNAEMLDVCSNMQYGFVM